VLRRALLIWGLGHLALGDRRGWVLLVLQPLAIASVSWVALQLIDGTRWLVVFAPLLVLLVVWLGQAVHAHRRAIHLGAIPAGEMQVAAFLPFALIVLTLFWLVGGRHGSAAATVEAYIEAWMDGRPEAAAALFETPIPAQHVTLQWTSTLTEIERLLDSGRRTYGPQSGLDPARPFNSLRVTQVDEPSGGAVFIVEIVRSERFATTALGVIPTAAQRTVVVEPVLSIALVEQADTSASLPNARWLISVVYQVGRLATS
jgi:hypothetical protein